MAGAPTVSALFAQRVVIGVGDMAVSNNPQVTLSTYALGSCVGIIAFDPVSRSGGILHIMLPDSLISPDKAAKQPAMFADTGLPFFFRALVGVKVERARMRVFLAGGASVLNGTDPFKIGERNAAAVKKILGVYKIPICGEDLGGTVNRTVHLELATAALTLKMPDRTEQYSLT
ncbi:MAG: chemotaxis protein CheD [Opitutaceae bacterium]|nr:chemotaxis protein CheD [Opitutaceae bacterium]